MSNESKRDAADVEVDVRPRIVEVLQLLANLRAQEEYQARAPSVNVPAELFNQWDDWYFPGDSSFRGEFSLHELRALEAFDATLRLVADKTPQHLPPLEVFSKTPAWMDLREAAERALSSVLRLAEPGSGAEASGEPSTAHLLCEGDASADR